MSWLIRELDGPFLSLIIAIFTTIVIIRKEMKNNLHCIGIGGIGVSALARLYKARGWQVSGSDLARSEITDALKKEGIRVFIGHRKSNLAPSVSKVVYTSAVRPNNPEIMEAKRRKIAALSYAQAVGELTREFKTIAIAGAHGKSTTTAMIALLLAKSGFNPTAIIGTKLREFKNSNFRLGKSPYKAEPPGFRPYFVLEADEYRASFLNYYPTIAVITNTDREHLDFYKNIRKIEATFLKFISGLKPNGIAVLNRDDPRLRRIAMRLRRLRRDLNIIWFSLRHPQAKKIKRILRIPGAHNVSNALAAYAVGRILRIPEKKILAALADYRGSWRRFDYQGRIFGAKVFADYAHHPTEIRATLAAAGEKFPRRRIVCVFQPHHYERTRDLFREFTRAFGRADAAVLLDIYEVAGREQNKKSQEVNSQKLAAAISRRGQICFYLHDPRQLKSFLEKRLGRGDILVMMGAGSIWEITKQLMKPKIRN